MAKGPNRAKGKAASGAGAKKQKAATSPGGKKQNVVNVAEQVRQRLRETFRALSHEEQHLNVQGDPPRTLCEQLTHDLDKSQAGDKGIIFGKNYNDKMKEKYRMKSAALQALTYHSTAVTDKTSAATDKTSSAASTDKTTETGMKETDIAPGLLRAPQKLTIRKSLDI